MDFKKLVRKSDYEWWIEPHGNMRVPGVIYASPELIEAMDDKVYEQVCNVATLPGIVKASFAMPDAHWGYGFPIGGVAAFDPEEGGVVSAGGVGFDISCGVRCLLTGLKREDIENVKERLADVLFRTVPAGVGSRGKIRLDEDEMNAMLTHGAQWAVDRGYGTEEDLKRIEEHGKAHGAKPDQVSSQAKQRMRDEVGTLGSGNHYLEVQYIAEVYDETLARAYGLNQGDAVVMIHCGSRGLGHQIGTDFLRKMVQEAPKYGITLPDRELACAPIRSPLGEAYFGAMRAGMNCALANRQVITHLTRQAFREVLPEANLVLLYDVSHNTCKEEEHPVNGQKKRLFVHRKGATRAWGPGHAELPPEYRSLGQPVLIGGSMGTGSYVLAGSETSERASFGSAVHGAGRALSRSKATKMWSGQEIVKELAQRGVIVRSVSMRGVAEEAPEAYKDVSEVVEAAEKAGLCKKVARCIPLICIKG
jgi:tRNA-splicing ligase RtcB